MPRKQVPTGAQSGIHSPDADSIVRVGGFVGVLALLPSELVPLFQPYFHALIDERDRGNIQPDDVFVAIIPPHVRLKHPIRLTIDRVQSHLVLIVGEGAAVTFIEDLQVTAAVSVHGAEVFVGDGAQCAYVSLQAAGSGSSVDIIHRSRIGTGVQIHWHIASLGAKNLQHDLKSLIAGTDSVSSVDWAFFARGRDKQHITVRNVFSAARGGGEIIIKGVASEQAQCAVTGMIEIQPAGGGTDTYLTEDVLMLDATAKVDATPALEIKTNDVKASHSASVARVTDEDIFYFAARGIPHAHARRMYVEGFLGDITQRIENAAVQQEMQKALAKVYAR